MNSLISIFLFFLFAVQPANCFSDYVEQKIKEYTRMIRETPDDPSGYYLRASFLWPFEKEAVSDYKKALELYLKDKNQSRRLQGRIS